MFLASWIKFILPLQPVPACEDKAQSLYLSKLSHLLRYQIRLGVYLVSVGLTFGLYVFEGLFVKGGGYYKLCGRFRDENLKVEGVRGQAKTRSERGETISGGLDSGMDWTNGEKQDFVGKELHQYLGKRKIKKDLRNLDKFVSWEIRVLWQSNRLELSRTGSNHDGIEARRENPKLDKNHNFGIMQVFDEAEGSGNIYRQEIYWKDRNQANGPRSSRWLVAWVQNVVSTTQQAECLQKLEVSPCMEALHAA
ncbi:hypothetical protein DY000_02041983 [Brassica cretica]|uniref:Uncharacterized protein n=1 Tax=Brassica cretica TaxID=69181 RepID=A0ABQ7BIR0_BRACR|nr:hypothetical protein DY000_02041983 [Brassica cretica]